MNGQTARGTVERRPSTRSSVDTAGKPLSGEANYYYSDGSVTVHLIIPDESIPCCLDWLGTQVNLPADPVVLEQAAEQFLNVADRLRGIREELLEKRGDEQCETCGVVGCMSTPRLTTMAVENAQTMADVGVGV